MYLFNKNFNKNIFHLNTVPGFMNDIQSIFYKNALYHLYYLWNGDASWGGNGTEWRHLTTDDFIHFADHGVAIPKYCVGQQGDVATGSILFDKDNIAGYGTEAILGYATAFGDKQRTNLWVSLDGGYSYIPSEYNPVQDNALNLDPFRDPFVMQDNQNILIYLAESNKIGIYRSPNGKNFTYVGGIMLDGYGLIECPCLCQIAIENNPLQKKTVLFFDANGDAIDQLSTGAYYCVGHLDAGIFKQESEIKRLDKGPDFYGSRVYFPMKADDIDQRLILGWVNNWNYAQNIAYSESAGTMSLCRQLTLTADNNILMTPFFPKGITTSSIEKNSITATAKAAAEITIAADSYKLEWDIDDAHPQAGYSFTVQGNGWLVAFHYWGADKTIHVERKCTDYSGNEEFEKIRVFSLNGEDAFHVSLFVDTHTIEVFFGQGASVYTAYKVNGSTGDKVVFSTDHDITIHYTKQIITA
ncbi:glycoside hydrolase family 32 protein [Zymomonas mobilis]|uniref:Glycosyl hydrolase family 32 domain protein n=1 Tax=Zymomonas mobilis subsp. pomaceae (strain ATCC 29192 / DSM 22645 / JCM 10191 / CCUG 17912 / NBRC 13757 / NCIMB 11200 / NRRL B-4491 / Barker I) TaxID=579138 RepID=F8ETW9_ZYMMT|nr:glycoside hydrolase family 32 protein [Zymomonas mobilis]AEI38066.1 Glycosyl hydrolase family 32 domain protein [Zymomonas mobilis subsp. pomaceae ATCC 29192]MDX5949433.1 glycoside hydrolase family 32 protein [Zymomonas mobilis subsp. pomaceae]GEB89176.1 levanbiose-producing levanase [Zymomonas mobilis subsp. pomaceae]